MKLFSGFLLVLAFLAVSACTGSDETTEVVKILCSATGELLEEGEKCPQPEDTSNNNTSGNQGGSTGGQTDTDTDTDKGAPTRSDCNIQVQGVTLDGTTEGDVICGNDRGNTIKGLAGDDTIYGGAGDDTLIGGDDRDVLRGEAGDDTLTGGQDDDTLDGGAGMDTADYSKEDNPLTKTSDDGVAPDPVTVNLAEGQATDAYGDVDTLISIENVIGTPGNDTIIGDSGPNEIDGGGASPNETDTLLDGGAGSDTIVVSDTDSDFTLDANPNIIKNFENIKAKAGQGNMNLTGDNKANVLTGNEGINELNGAGGNDRLIGGAEADCFIIEIPSGFVEVGVNEVGDNVSSDPDNAGRKTVIRGTKDTISDYQAGETIVINNAATPAYVHGTDDAKTAPVKSVIIRKGAIEVVTQKYRPSDNDTPDEPADDVTGISQQTETLVTVPGLLGISPGEEVTVDGGC